MVFRVICTSTEDDRVYLNEVSESIVRGKNIVTIAGAGISTSSGIPDFRSADGLYQTRGKQLFDAEILRCQETKSEWFKAMARFKHEMVDESEPSPAHWFIRMLDLQQKLLCHFSQNIDGLETVTGMADRTAVTDNTYKGGVVFLHGDVNVLRCERCDYQESWNTSSVQDLSAGKAPLCPDCQRRANGPVVRPLRPRPIGALRPNIVLYGEHQSNGEEIAHLINRNLQGKPDVLIVMGTSLSVPAVRDLVKSFAIGARKGGGFCVLVNKTDVASVGRWRDVFDYHVKDDVNDWVKATVSYWMAVKPSDWEPGQAHPNLIKRYSLLREPNITAPIA